MNAALPRVVAVALGLAAVGSAQVPSAAVSVQLASGPLTLADGDAHALAEKAPRALSCSIDSFSSPDLLGRPPAQRWDETIRGRHLRVRYETPIRIELPDGGELWMSEVLIGLDGYLYPRLSREGNLVVEFARCDHMPALLCRPPLARHVDPKVQDYCRMLEQEADAAQRTGPHP